VEPLFFGDVSPDPGDPVGGERALEYVIRNTRIGKTVILNEWKEFRVDAVIGNRRSFSKKLNQPVKA